MEPFPIIYRAKDVKHSCRYKNDNEPYHDSRLQNSIDSIIKITESMQYRGEIKSSANSYQVNLGFDQSWINCMKGDGWKDREPQELGSLREIHDMQPDAILSKGGISLVIEIEKSNKGAIWFDFMKIMAVIGKGVADFGILVVPRNYAHGTGVWDNFEAARYYRLCLAEYAKADRNLLSIIAILGYTQEVQIDGKWVQLGKDSMNKIKNKARAFLPK